MEEKTIKPKFKDVLAPMPSMVQKEESVVDTTRSSDEASEEVDAPEEEKVRPTVIDPNEPLFHAVADYLNITDQRDYSDAVPKVQKIVDYIVRDGGSSAYEDVMTKLSELTHSIAKPDFEVKLYKHLYRYVTLKEQQAAINKAVSAWEGRKSGNGN